jgi:S1-C subfamily serine protease
VQASGGKVAVGGDIIVGVDGKAITSAEDLSGLVASKKPGDTISVEVRRATGNGAYERKTLKVTLASRPNSIKNPSTPEG